MPYSSPAPPTVSLPGCRIARISASTAGTISATSVSKVLVVLTGSISLVVLLQKLVKSTVEGRARQGRQIARAAGEHRHAQLVGQRAGQLQDALHAALIGGPQEFARQTAERGAHRNAFGDVDAVLDAAAGKDGQDRKSTRLNSSHVKNSYAIFG